MLDASFIDLANQMADVAGDIARQYFRTKLAIDNKSDTSPVTIADREIETALRALIEAQFPEHGIIGEEFGNVREGAQYQWVLDPIDGTHAFINDQPTFTTLIALAKDGIPLFGLISQAITGERWIGVDNTTTYTCHPERSRRVLRSLDKLGMTLINNATLATTAMRYFTPEQANLFNKVQKQCANVKFGGDAYLYAKLASGEIDIVIEAGLKPYDFCALKPVIEGAGGIITDWKGKPLSLASDGRVIAAANTALHKAVLALLMTE